MRSYVHHIGDWMTATAYCDWMECAAYHKLVEAYYAAEQPFPDNLTAIYRSVGAVGKAEKEATRRALSQFFQLGTDGNWHQKRCDAEIARAHEFKDSQRAKIDKRWKDQRESAENVLKKVAGPGNSPSVAKNAKMRILESPGAVIRADPPGTLRNGMERPSDTAGITAELPPVIPNLLPIPINTLNAAAISASAAQACAQAAAAAAAVGLEINPNDPRLLAAVADGTTPAEVRFAAAKAAAAGKGWEYAFGALAGMRRDAAAGIVPPERKTPASGPNYPMLPRADRRS